MRVSRVLRMPKGYKEDNRSASEDNQDARVATARSNFGLGGPMLAGEYLLVLVDYFS